MKLLLDTHFLIWMMEESTKLRPVERTLLQRHASSTSVSVVSLWEIRIKWNRFDREGRRRGTVDPFRARTFAETGGMTIADLTADSVVAPLVPPVDHNDPFDEMLLVHARQLGARLLTRDRLLVDHPLAFSA